MLAQVEVCTAMNTFNLFKPERHFELNICSGICIMGKFLMIMETIILSTEAQSLMPFHTRLFPLCEPLHFGTRLNKELHLHLFKLPHTENELACNYLITESLAYLSYSERNFHTSCFLDIEIIYEYTLCCFRTQVYLTCSISGRSHFCREHKIKLTHIGPVFSTTYRTYDAFVQNYLFQFIKVHCIHGFLITLMQCITFFLMF